MFLAHLAQTRRRFGLASLAVQLYRAPNVQTSVLNSVLCREHYKRQMQAFNSKIQHHVHGD